MRILLFAVALIAGGAAYWLWLTQASMLPAASGVTSVSRVLTAARDIPAGAVVSVEDVAWADIQSSRVSAGMRLQINEPEADKLVVGLKAQEAFASGDPILWTALDKGGATALGASLAADKRAFAIVVSEASAVGGLVLPGDRIDLVQNTSSGGTISAEVIATDLRVLAVDQQLAPAAGQVAMPGRTLTLELTIAQVPLISAANARGGLSVVLRGPSP
jgi:pilus assembly protein CpaB